MSRIKNVKVLSTLLLFLMSVNTSVWSQESDEHRMHMDHSAHMKMMQNKDFTVTDAHYDIPDEVLIDASGKKTQLRKILDQGQPVALNFIFTTCTTICPVMTATFAQMRQQLGKASSKVQLVSITIDPEYDRPEVLKEYAARFGASDGWSFLTGDGNSINKVLRSFDVYAGSKMNHQPITLFKNPKSSSWIRVKGLASGKQMASLVTKRLLN